MILRRCYGGQEDRRWAGGEELLRGQSSPAAVRRGNSGATQAEVGEEGPGEDPGRAAGLLRWLARAGRARCGWSVVAQRTLRGGAVRSEGEDDALGFSGGCGVEMVYRGRGVRVKVGVRDLGVCAVGRAG